MNTGFSQHYAWILTVRSGIASMGGSLTALKMSPCLTELTEKIWAYKNNGYLIFGITNQGGVAYGFKTEAAWQAELAQTVGLFDRDPFDHVAYSLLHPKGRKKPYNHRTLLRKPEIGMLAACEVVMFQQNIVVDWDNSIFVGDRPEDEECANRAGLAFIHADIFFEREKTGS